jgi:hypothetical protein
MISKFLPDSELERLVRTPFALEMLLLRARGSILPHAQFRTKVGAPHLAATDAEILLRMLGLIRPSSFVSWITEAGKLVATELLAVGRVGSDDGIDVAATKIRGVLCTMGQG